MQRTFNPGDGDRLVSVRADIQPPKVSGCSQSVPVIGPPMSNDSRWPAPAARGARVDVGSQRFADLRGDLIERAAGAQILALTRPEMVERDVAKRVFSGAAAAGLPHPLRSRPDTASKTRPATIEVPTLLAP